MNKPKIEKNRAALKYSVTALVFFAAGIAAQLVLSDVGVKNNTHMTQMAQESLKEAATDRVDLNTGVIKTATGEMAQKSLVYVSGRMPNTRFVGAHPYENAPGLIALMPESGSTPVFFDPVRKYLLIGLVINMSPDANPHQDIAGGKLK